MVSTFGLKVLLVGEDQEMRRSIASALKSDGHDVVLSSTCVDAVEHARASRTDAVLLDAQLREGNAYELARALRQTILPPDAVIIVLASEGVPVPADRATEPMIDLELTKALDFTQLSSLIHYVFSKRRGAPRLT